MRFRSKLLICWALTVLLLLVGTLLPFTHAVQSSFDRLTDAGFAGARENVRRLRADEVDRMRQAGALVMNIPELRALIAEHNYELTADNLTSLQERLDSLSTMVGVTCVCVADARGVLIAQNSTSPWKTLAGVSAFFHDDAAGRSLLAHTLQSEDGNALDGMWLYGGKLYQAVGVPLVFNGSSPDGVLILATPWTNAQAVSLGRSHDCEISLLSPDATLATSLPANDADALLRKSRLNRWPVNVAFNEDRQEGQLRSWVEPVVDPNSGNRLGVMVIQSAEHEAAAIQSTVLRTLCMIAGIELAAAVIVSIVISGRLTRPVRQLVQGVQRVAGGDLELSLPVQSRDELGQLAVAFNDMVTQLRTRRQLQQLVDESLAANNAKKPVSGQHEPRDPYPLARRDWHQRFASSYRARRPPAPVRKPYTQLGRCADDADQRHSRLLKN